VLFSAALVFAVPTRLSAQSSQAPAAAKIAADRKAADTLYDEGKYEEAKALYVGLVDSFRDDFFFNKRLADCYFYGPKTDFAEAAKYYARATALNPKDAEVETNLAKSYVWSKQAKAAIPVLRHIIARDPNYPETRLLLARAQNSASQFQEARATYQAYLQRWPADREVRLEFAALLSWNKQYNAALEQYRYILKIDPRNLPARLGEARVLSWQGPLEESLIKYNDILRYVPDNPEAQRGRAFVLLWMRRYEEAEGFFRELARQNPADKDIQDALAQIARWKAEAPQREAQAQVDALIKAASASASQGDYPHAIEQLSQAIARAPSDDLRFRLGEYYLRGGQKDQAIGIFQKLYAEHPDNLDALRELGNAQFQAGRPGDAMATYRSYLQRSPNPGVEVSLARLLSWSGGSEEATAIYERVLRADPRNLEASLGLAQVLSWQQKYPQSLQVYDGILRDHPLNRDALLGKAQALDWSGQHDQALATLESAASSWPQDTEIASALSSARNAARQRALEAKARAAASAPIDERIRMARETLAHDPNNVGALRELAEIYQGKRDYRQAVSYFEQALKQNPSDRGLQLGLAQVSGWSGNYDRAIALYRGLLAQDPSNRDERLELAKLLSWSGHKPESIEEYGVILQRSPNDVEAHLGRARVLSWSKQPDEALADYAAVLKADPLNRDAQVERARVLSWKGDQAGALRAYTDVLTRVPGDRDALFGKAQILFWSGRPREAAAILEELRAKEPGDAEVGLALASVQSALGREDLALRELDDLDRLRPGNTEVAQMRRSLTEALRPLLVLRAGPSVDSDDLRIYSAGATLYFHLVPQILSYVSAGFIPSREPGSDWENARETVFGSSARVNSWLGLRGEIGANSSSAGFVSPIGGFGITLYAGNRVRFDIDASRRFVNYVPLPVRLNISREELRPSFEWDLDKYSTLHLDYFHQDYSDMNRDNGGNLYLTRRLVHGERFELEAGYHYYGFSFTRHIYSGYWAPRLFQEHMGVVNLSEKLSSRLSMSFRGTLGENQSREQGAALEPFRLAGSAQVGGDYSLSNRLKLSLGAGYYSTASIRILGSPSSGYKAYLASGRMEYRF
jgi:tetratricopeptide (TPR) repeat protein